MATEVLPLPAARRTLPVRIIGALVGTAAVGALIVYSLRLTTAATLDPAVLVPSSHVGYPSWMARCCSSTPSAVATTTC